VLYITNAFTKYAVVTGIQNKNAETVPSSKSGSENLEYQPRYTPMEGKNSSVNWLQK
jgi:hypothetical protein